MLGNIHCDFTDVHAIDELREQIKSGTITGVSSKGNHAVIHYNTKLEEQAREAEWVNGDIAYVENSSHDEIKFIGLSGNSAVAVCECITESRKVVLDKFWVSDLLKEKPETEKQRKEREKLEAAYELYCHWCIAMEYPKFSLEQFTACERDKAGMLAIVDKTSYRAEQKQ